MHKEKTMKATQTASLFADLSTEEAQTVQGGCRRYHSFRPSYYYYSRPRSSYFPSFSYGYGYGGYGYGGSSSSAVNQTVNVNVQYDD